MQLGTSDYILTICEKPDAARRIARALGSSGCREEKIDGISLYVSKDGGKTYVVCSALGHLYTLEDPTSKRRIYPVLDVEWMPVSKGTGGRIARILAVIGRLAKNASVFVNSCDYDQEGEVIGHNILRYACKNKHGTAYRAKFSALTEEELRSAFENLEQSSNGRLADAGRARHMLDFIYGVNLSRALSESVYRFSKRFRNLTIGRVQGPTLSFVVDREKEIRSHVPIPYWLVTAKFENDGEVFQADYEKGRVAVLAEAEEIVRACKGKDGKVADLSKKTAGLGAPPPFNLGDLQREAYRCFRFSPSFTLAIAERLYLDALISYPRTSSQKLPRSLNYGRIIGRLAKINVYSQLAANLLGRSGAKRGLVPKEGSMDDPAHPAIHPTGELPGRRLEGTEWKLYDLIVKRFLATFGEPAVIERILATIDVSGYRFLASGRHTLREGWIRYYRPYGTLAEVELPELGVDEVITNKGVKSQEKFTEPPPRYTEAGLLEKMEIEQIGTKATRAEIIRTLIGRGYMTSGKIEATELGFAVVESMRAYMPDIVSTEVTREMERRLEQVELGNEESHQIIGDAVTKLLRTLTEFKSMEQGVGKGLDAAVAITVSASRILGKCPLCSTGQLRMIRSKKSGKRFVGCSNYEKGCKASMPLPQKGTIKIARKACGKCGWPVVYVFFGRRYPWRLCINIECPTKRSKAAEKTAVKDPAKIIPRRKSSRARSA